MDPKFLPFEYDRGTVEALYTTIEAVPSFKISELYRRTAKMFAEREGVYCDNHDINIISIGDAKLYAKFDKDEIIGVHVKGGRTIVAAILQHIKESSTLFGVPVISISSNTGSFETEFDILTFTSVLYRKYIGKAEHPEANELRGILSSIFKAQNRKSVVEQFIEDFPSEYIDSFEVGNDKNYGRIILSREFSRQIGGHVFHVIIDARPTGKIRSFNFMGSNLRPLERFLDEVGVFGTVHCHCPIAIIEGFPQHLTALAR